MTNTKRVEKTLWSDIIMSQKDPAQWAYKPAHYKIDGAKPAIYTATITKSGNSTASKTITIGGVTITATSSTPGEDEYATTATAAEIATILAAHEFTGFTVTASDNTVIFTQTVPGTGSKPSNTGDDTTASISVADTQAYAPSGNTVRIIPGDILVLDTAQGNSGYDAKGVPFVKAFDASSFTYGTTVVVGLCTDDRTIEATENDTIPVCVRGVQIVLSRMPTSDVYGNTIDYTYSSTSVVKALEELDIMTGDTDKVGLY